MDRIDLRRWYPYLLLVPMLPFFLATMLFPMGLSLYYSFMDYRPLYSERVSFVGLTNYARLVVDPIFIRSLGTTLGFVVLAIGIKLLLGLAIALVLNSMVRGRRILVTIIAFPMMIAPAIAAMSWRFLFLPTFGPINYILELVGIPRVNWLGGIDTVFFTAVIIEVWQGTSFFVLVLLAGLLTVPPDQYESAALDGAGRWGIFRHVTLPWIRPLILVVVLWGIIGSIRAFESIYLSIGKTGGPGQGAYLLGLLLAEKAFGIFDMGISSALAWIMFPITILITIGLVVFVYKEVEL